MKTAPLILAAALLAVTRAPAAQQPAALNVAAPEFTAGQWLNTPKGRPIPLASRRGKVTVVEFWTFGCINCRHNLPIYDRWHRRFAESDVAVIGIHTPETEPERDSLNVSRKVQEFGIEYPVLIDSQLMNWERWHQRYWPAVYLIDKRGRIRYRWEGEMTYGGVPGEALMTRLITQLLEEP